MNDLHFLHSRLDPSSGGEVIELNPVPPENIFYGMVGGGLPMKELFRRIREVADTNSAVLIEGSRGSGKKLVAHAVHRMGCGNFGTMKSVHCSALFDDWPGEGLFGDNRTLFLEEAGNLSMNAQKKLLESLEERASVDIRLVASSSVSLEEKVADGGFDEGLFRYFSGKRIEVPSLRERTEDIPLLLAYFLGRGSDGESGVRIEGEALELLLSHDWPGNVGELEGLSEQWKALNFDELIKSSNLPDKFIRKSRGIVLSREGIDLKKVLSDIEDSLIRQALRMTRDNKNKASKLLRINRTTLIEKMKKKGFMKTNQYPPSK